LRLGVGPRSGPRQWPIRLASSRSMLSHAGPKSRTTPWSAGWFAARSPIARGRRFAGRGVVWRLGVGPRSGPRQWPTRLANSRLMLSHVGPKSRTTPWSAGGFAASCASFRRVRLAIRWLRRCLAVRRWTTEWSTTMAHPLGEQSLDVVARSAKVADHSVVRWLVCCQLRELPSRAVTDSLVEALFCGSSGQSYSCSVQRYSYSYSTGS
jgi:hypothetical protein